MRFFGRTRTPWEGDFPLTRRRIYVLPSRMGLIFAGALLVMLVLTAPGEVRRARDRRARARARREPSLTR